LSRFVIISSPMGYLEIGHVRRPVQAGVDAYPLLPGVYTPYGSHSDWVSITPVKLFVLPECACPEDAGRYQPQVQPTARAQATIQEKSNAFLDQCLAEQSKPVKDCVLLNRDAYRYTHSLVYGIAVTAATFRLVRYPVVTAPGIALISGRGVQSFRLLPSVAGNQVAPVYGSVAPLVTQAAVPGELRLTGSGRRMSDGRTVSFNLSCAVDRSWLTMRIEADGSISTEWAPVFLNDLPVKPPYIPIYCPRPS
jgi:hypothetical protein